MLRALIVAGALAAMLAAAAHAAPGVVTTQQGQRYTGDVTEGEKAVTVKIHGVEMVLSRQNVARIEYTAPESPADAQGDAAVEQEYNRRHAQLPAADAEGRLTLARWAFDRKAYGLARQAADEARQLDPNDPDASLLLDTIQSQIRIEKSRTEPPVGDAADPGIPPVAAPANLLDDRQINAIRQRELPPEQAASVRYAFDHDVRRRYAERSEMLVQQLMSLPAPEQAMRILHGAESDDEMRADVRVLSDPPALLEFRRAVLPGVLSSCGTTQCHGGPAAGELMLVNPVGSDAAVYTDFYLLQAYARQQNSGAGVFGGGELKMIDRVRPGESLLLQYGLPPNLATYDHPPVRNWRPVHRNRNDRGYQRILDWISSSLRSDGGGDYGFEFELSPADMPAPPAQMNQQAPQSPEPEPMAPATEPFVP